VSSYDFITGAEREVEVPVSDLPPRRSRPRRCINHEWAHPDQTDI
jgi:hypothetical protein